MSIHISNLCKTVNFYIRNVWRVRRFIIQDACHHGVRRLVVLSRINPNSIIHHQTSQKLSSKHAARGVAQSPYPIYRHGKACLSKQPPWRAAGDPRLARGRSRVRAPGPAGALRALFLHPPFLPPSGDSFFRTFPHQTHESVRVNYANSVLFGAREAELKRLQRLQNKAARLVFACGRDRCSVELLNSLHWLQVKDRTCFKMMQLYVYKCIMHVAEKQNLCLFSNGC